ncbi:MAG TPA: hypothetical protein ENH00_10000 [Actinobacteria bacterium]|nr:hypothetical protein BMS3Bbin01_02452 [bacterium BMS3Bbin01]HDH26503.1 hypothetical protein [Actinomycetota bacterium]
MSDTHLTVLPNPSHRQPKGGGALRSVADRRSIDLPPAFSVPDRELWERGYAAEAGCPQPVKQGRYVVGEMLSLSLEPI